MKTSTIPGSYDHLVARNRSCYVQMDNGTFVLKPYDPKAETCKMCGALIESCDWAYCRTCGLYRQIAETAHESEREN